MEKSKTVSIWLGSWDSAQSLQEYLQVNYGEDGDYIDSEFENDFNIQCFDEDLREISYLEKPSTSFSSILSDHSFCKSIIRNFTQKLDDDLGREYNAVILIYDFKYMGSVKEIENRNMYIKFIGSMDYEKEYC